MSDEVGFLQAIQERPEDEDTWLVYADWLEERSDPRAEFLRIESELLALSQTDACSAALRTRLRELHQALAPDWVDLVRRLPLDPLDELRAVLSPPKRPFRAAGNWEEVETALGLSLPADYKAFIATYGGGTIGSLVEIPSPFSFGVDIRQRWESWASFFDDLAEYEEVPYPVFPQSGGLLPFGTLGTVDILGWRTVGEPDRWPFVYYDRDEGFFEVQGLSAVEFVLEAVTQRSPLLIRLRSESGFDPPCDFEPFMAEPRSIEFVHHREIDLDVLTERLASRWPAEQVQIRRGPVGARLLIEPLAGQISLSSDTGDERTLAGIYYDQSCSPRVEESIQDLLNAGFTEIRRG